MGGFLLQMQEISAMGLGTNYSNFVVIQITICGESVELSCLGRGLRTQCYSTL